MPERETSAEIDAVAAEWAVRVDNAPLDTQEQASLDAWLGGDTRRLGAYARARAAFLHARRAKALGSGFDPDTYLAQQTFDAGENADVDETPVAHPIRRRAFLIGGAAIAASTVGIFGLSWQAAAETYSTKRGEIRLIPLADGSTMTLNTESTARVKFTRTERHVELVEGEALFDVARNPARPFVVAAGHTVVRAVGTSFTVSRLADRPVQVLVRQGVVEVEGSASALRTPHRVVANSKAVIAAAQPVAVVAVAPNEVTRELAWREGMLSFEDMPLRDAADQFARYSDMRIVFADPAIGSQTVTGLFAANNPAGFARSAALSLGLRANVQSDAIILAPAD